MDSMARIIFVSGACGSGKTAFADAYSRYLVSNDHKTVYVIHGDDFHRGFVEPEDKEDNNCNTGIMANGNLRRKEKHAL